jgi:hypothetical protein
LEGGNKMFHQNQKQDVIVNYNIDKVYWALLQAVEALSGFKLKNENRVTHTITINVSVSWFSWGELMDVSLADLGDNKTQINVSSGSKLGTEIVANSKNRKNIDKLMNSMTYFLEQL